MVWLKTPTWKKGSCLADWCQGVTIPCWFVLPRFSLIYIYIHIHMYSYIHILIFLYIHTFIFSYIHIFAIHSYIYIYTHTYIVLLIYIYINTVSTVILHVHLDRKCGFTLWAGQIFRVSGCHERRNHRRKPLTEQLLRFCKQYLGWYVLFCMMGSHRNLCAGFWLCLKRSVSFIVLKHTHKFSAV